MKPRRGLLVFIISLQIQYNDSQSGQVSESWNVVWFEKDCVQYYNSLYWIIMLTVGRRYLCLSEENMDY